MAPQTRLAAVLATAVALASAVLAMLALLTSAQYADSRVLSLGWLLAPAVGATAYLSAGWGVAAVLGAVSAQLAGAAVARQESGLLVVATVLAVGALAALVGRLTRLAESHETRRS